MLYAPIPTDADYGSSMYSYSAHHIHELVFIFIRGMSTQLLFLVVAPVGLSDRIGD